MDDFRPAYTNGSPPFYVPHRDPTSTEPPRPRLKRVDEFLGEYTPLSYAVEPIVRTGSLYTCTAITGSGKTALLISTAFAVVTGRREILNLGVVASRVAFLTFENPDDVRMRMMVSAFLLNINVRTISDRLLILDMRTSPEAVLSALEADGEPFGLIIVDTLAAMFDGPDANDNVQAGNFMRRLRPLTRMAGLPSVLVAAHPVKNATREQLVPYGGGAILNEVAGNLTLWRKPETGTVEMHWQGKLRGLEFQPVQFRFELSTSPDVLDANGREVSLPTMVPAKLSDQDEDAKAAAEADIRIALLKAIRAEPGKSYRQYALAIARLKTRVGGLLNQLSQKKLVENPSGFWSLTTKGEKEVEKWG